MNDNVRMTPATIEFFHTIVDERDTLRAQVWALQTVLGQHQDRLHDEIIYCRDVDGTGSMHPCSREDPGAVAFVTLATLDDEVDTVRPLPPIESCPQAVKGAITTFDKATQAYAFLGAEYRLAVRGSITADYKRARHALETAVVTQINKGRK